MWLVLLSRFQSHLNIIAKFLLWIEPILRPPRGLLLITLCQATLQIPCEFKVPFQRKQRLMEDILKWSQTSVGSSWRAEERNNHLAGKSECHLHIADGLCDVLEKFASLWSNLNPMPCWIKLLAPELLYQKGKEMGGPLCLRSLSILNSLLGEPLIKMVNLDVDKHSKISFLQWVPKPI